MNTPPTLLHSELLDPDMPGITRDGHHLDHAEAASKPLRSRPEPQPRGAKVHGNRPIDQAEAAARFIAAPEHEKMHDERLWDETKLMRAEIVRQIQSLLTADTTVIAETGDSWFNGVALKLPGGARFEVEMQWGSIGWSVPATFGYAVGAPNRRIIAMIGDGSFQLTAQEVAQMIRRKLPVIIFLINNHGYTIEVEIHDGPYNNIKNWDYAGLIQAFNAEDGNGQGIRVTNGGELAEAI